MLLGPTLRYLTAMCSLGWGNLAAFDWNDLPVDREFNGKFLEMSNPHPMPRLPIPVPPLPAC